MTKEDYIQWRNQEVTGEFHQAALREVDNIIADLVVSAGVDSKMDSYRRGRIDGLKALVEWVPAVSDLEIIEEGDEDDGSDSEGTPGSY